LREELHRVMEGAEQDEEKWKEILDQAKNTAKDAEDKLGMQLQVTVRPLPFYESVLKKNT
jgi:hypothetical protein